MSAARIKDIISNLDFAHESNRELSTLISEAQKIDGAVKHVSQKAAAILAALRECFDYCIADIKNDFLAHETRKVYYPFHPDTLGKGKPLYGLLQTALPVYDKLLSVANAIQTGEVIKGTMCLYGDARAVNDLVNSKKHDRVIEVCESGRSKSRIEFPNGTSITVTPMFPLGANGLPDFSKPGPVGPEAWLQTPGVRVIAVKDFFFDVNGIEMSRIDVHGFCMTAITATRFILGEVYSEVYGQPFNLFHEKG